AVDEAYEACGGIGGGDEDEPAVGGHGDPVGRHARQRDAVREGRMRRAGKIKCYEVELGCERVMRDHLVRPGQVEAGTVGRHGHQVRKSPDPIRVAVAGLTEDMDDPVAPEVKHGDGAVLVVEDVGEGPVRVDGDGDGPEADGHGPVHLVVTDADEVQPAE